jgi:uncharacterized protein YkwD
VRGLTRLAALPLAAAALSLPAASRADAGTVTLVLGAINAERAANGLPPLRRERSLSTVARRHAARMVAHKRFSHGAFQKRIAHSAWAHRHSAWYAGETLAWGTGVRGTPGGVVAAWMNSPEHRQIMLDPRYHVVGIGVVRGVPVRGRVRGANGRTYAADFGS